MPNFWGNKVFFIPSAKLMNRYWWNFTQSLFNPQSRTASYQRCYKNGTSSSLV